MLKTLNNWWRQEDGNTEEPELKLAITKLMVGMVAMDGIQGNEQYDEVTRLLGKKFDLKTEEAKSLMEQAMDKDRDDLCFSKIVTQIENHYTVEERVKILGKLWSIAIADGDVDFLEEQYINRLSGLLGVSPTMLGDLKDKQERLFPNLNQTNRYQEPAS